MNDSIKEKQPIIIALDVSTLEEVKAIVQKLDTSILWYKVGLQLFLAQGNGVIEYLKSKNKNIFLDLKFFDIPNTVSHAVKSVLPLDIDFISIHALGGAKMIYDSREMIEKNKKETKILSITILTSMDKPTLNNEVGIAGEVEENVIRLADMAIKNGSHGIVCSPIEIASIRSLDKNAIITTPGIRFKDDNMDDQKRVMTPKDALCLGGNYLVMGRSLVGKDNAKTLIDEINKLAGL